jgi:hypothetical protein
LYENYRSFTQGEEYPLNAQHYFVKWKFLRDGQPAPLKVNQRLTLATNDRADPSLN